MYVHQTASRRPYHHTESGVVERVYERDEHYEVSSTAGSFILNKPCQPEPVVGKTVRLHLQNHNRVQGVDIDGQSVFFKTDKQLEDERLAALEKMEIRKAQERVEFYAMLADPRSDFNLRMNKLPKVFRQRMAKFFRQGKDFWYVARYELYTCEAAVKIANACCSRRNVYAFLKSSSDEMKTEVLGKDIHNYLSGHQFTFACRLASSYIFKATSVRSRPGALQVLAGPETYTG